MLPERRHKLDDVSIPTVSRHQSRGGLYHLGQFRKCRPYLVLIFTIKRMEHRQPSLGASCHANLFMVFVETDIDWKGRTHVYASGD